MAFISISDHEKFIKLFQSSLMESREDSDAAIADENAKLLESDIHKLQKIIREYKDTVLQLQQLADQYKIILQRAKVNMRKRQIKVNRQRARPFTYRR